MQFFAKCFIFEAKPWSNSSPKLTRANPTSLRNLPLKERKSKAEFCSSHVFFFLFFLIVTDFRVWNYCVRFQAHTSLQIEWNVRPTLLSRMSRWHVGQYMRRGKKVHGFILFNKSVIIKKQMIPFGQGQHSTFWRSGQSHILAPPVNCNIELGSRN